MSRTYYILSTLHIMYDRPFYVVIFYFRHTTLGLNIITDITDTLKAYILPLIVSLKQSPICWWYPNWHCLILFVHLSFPPEVQLPRSFLFPPSFPSLHIPPELPLLSGWLYSWVAPLVCSAGLGIRWTHFRSRPESPNFSPPVFSSAQTHRLSLLALSYSSSDARFLSRRRRSSYFASSEPPLVDQWARLSLH